MNFSLIVEAIRFASEHKEDIAAGGHAAITGIQKIETLCHKHNKSLDHVLHVADRVFDAVANPPTTGCEKGLSPSLRGDIPK